MHACACTAHELIYFYLRAKCGFLKEKCVVFYSKLHCLHVHYTLTYFFVVTFIDFSLHLNELVNYDFDKVIHCKVVVLSEKLPVLSVSAVQAYSLSLSSE